MRSVQDGAALPHFVHLETRQKRVRRWSRPRSLGDQRERFSVASLPSVWFGTRGEGNGCAPRSLVPPHRHGQAHLSRQATVNYATMRSRVVARIVRITWPHLSGQTERGETSRLLRLTHVCTFVSSGVNETTLILLCRCTSSLARRLILPQHQRSARRHPVIRAECLECRVHATRRGRQRLRKQCYPGRSFRSRFVFGEGTHIAVGTMTYLASTACSLRPARPATLPSSSSPK